jgi:hypothetical protein
MNMLIDDSGKAGFRSNIMEVAGWPGIWRHISLSSALSLLIKICYSSG